MNLVQQLRDELVAYGIPCSEEQGGLLVSYLNLVIEKNKVVNLTRISDPVEAVTLHLVDSLLPLACEEVTIRPDDSFLDMGTGAGFPGAPVALLTGAQALLVDSVGKKVAAVDEFAQQLGLIRVTTKHARLEDLARTIPGTQDYVFARAVAQTNVLIEYATPFLKQNGILVVEKGRPEDRELFEAERAAEICGLVPVSRETFELPRDLGHREILLYRRVRKSRIKLPRKVGMAKSNPLGQK
ncbi:MAG: 16S rRNA (guanine(527)-N(7))-methyltransferase RsmG [Atopobiaceae bacterium]|nr:16S rRNA (guanine(527)-N(7))-methyltransferase RsmG [Atopobiaceae bacterium]